MQEAHKGSTQAIRQLNAKVETIEAVADGQRAADRAIRSLNAKARISFQFCSCSDDIELGPRGNCHQRPPSPSVKAVMDAQRHMMKPTMMGWVSGLASFANPMCPF